MSSFLLHFYMKLHSIYKNKYLIKFRSILFKLITIVLNSVSLQIIDGELVIKANQRIISCSLRMETMKFDRGISSSIRNTTN